MSLALLQGYSSAEEEEERLSSSSLSGNEDDAGDLSAASAVSAVSAVSAISAISAVSAVSAANLHRPPSAAGEKNASSSNSSLPSVSAAFAEVVGPPEFLNNSVVEGDKEDGERDGGRRGKGRARRERKDLPPGVIVESKPQLIGIRDRVRSDIGASSQAASSNTITGEGKRVISAANPDAKDAAELLRMCLQCGVPKTYSHARGVVCPVCGDHPQSDLSKELEKKKGSTVKEKEKNKRMKGQSSHATWKSETEMHLRQQYD